MKQHNLKFWSCIAAASLTAVAMFQGEAPAAKTPDPQWLFECYDAGRLDTLRDVLDNLSDSTAEGLFFHGVFESDGDAACFYYDRVLALFPGTAVEARALDRLWQYHWAKGERQQAHQFWDFLRQRHPEYTGFPFKPDFDEQPEAKPTKNLQIGESLSPAGTSTNTWGVQIGAFSKSAGAKNAAKKVEKFGKVRLIPKQIEGKNLTLVIVGSFNSREEAAETADKIRQAVGFEGSVVVWEK